MAANNAVESQSNGHFLGPTAITRENVQEAFREYLNDDQISLEKADADIIAAGHGFTSYIIRLTLTWSDKDKKKHQDALPKSAILKALSKEAIEKMFGHLKVSQEEFEKIGFMQLLVKGHDIECTIYDMFGKKDSKPPVPVARAYATWKSGANDRPPMMLVEDLGDRARVLGDGSLSLTLEQLLNLAEAQASLHTWCLTTKDEWRNKFETFEDRMQMMAAFIPMMQRGLESAKQAFPDEFGALDEAKLGKLFEIETMRKMHDTYKAWMPDVLVHGDFWANNVMFNKLPDGSMGNEIVAVIDWQMPMIGNPTFDLGRVLSMSTDADLIEAHMEKIVKHYYDHLVKKLGDQKPKEMTYDRVLKLVHEYTAVSCLMFVMMQDTLHAMFAPGDNPEDEAKRQRLIKRTKGGLKYASKILDIVATKNDK